MLATVLILAVVLVLVMAFSLYGGPGGVGPVRARRRTIVDRPARPSRRRRVVEERYVEDEPRARRYVEEEPPARRYVEEEPPPRRYVEEDPPGR